MNEAWPIAAVVLVVSLHLPLPPAPVSAGTACTGRARPGALRSALRTGGGPAGARQPRDLQGASPFRSGLGLDAIEPEQDGVLVVNATPASARVFLDGRPLGTAGDLLARALPLESGLHVVAIVAPAFRPWVARVTADPPYSTRIRVELVPE